MISRQLDDAVTERLQQDRRDRDPALPSPTPRALFEYALRYLDDRIAWLQAERRELIEHEEQRLRDAAWKAYGTDTDRTDRDPAEDPQAAHEDARRRAGDA